MLNKPEMPGLGCSDHDGGNSFKDITVNDGAEQEMAGLIVKLQSFSNFMRKGDRNANYREICELNKSSFDKEHDFETDELFSYLLLDPNNVASIAITRMANFFSFYICNICMDLAHILYYLYQEKNNENIQKKDRDNFNNHYSVFTHLRTLKMIFFLADLSLIYKEMDLLFQRNKNHIDSLTNSKIKIEKMINHLFENKGKFEIKFLEILRKNGDDYYYYNHKISKSSQHVLRSEHLKKTIDEFKKINLNKAWKSIQDRVYDKNEIEPKTKKLLFINWMSTNNNKSEEFVIDEFGKKDVKYLCRVFYRDFDVTWESLQCLKRFILRTFDLFSCPVGITKCAEFAVKLSERDVFVDAIRLYKDIYSIGIHAMWIERFNKKASILSGDKHKINLCVDKMNWMVNINEMGPVLQDYDIRSRLLRLAYSAKPHSINIDTAMTQPWCRGVFTIANVKMRKNEHFNKKMNKWLNLKPKRQ